MKGRILALIASLLISGSAGVYAKTAAATQCPTAPASTAATQTATTPASVQDTVAKAASLQNPTLTVVSRAASSCPKQTVSSTPVAASSKPATASSKPAATSSKAATGTTCTQNTACSQNTYCSQNAACAASQKTCTQNACAPVSGKTCTQNSNCGNTIVVNGNQNYNDVINSILSRLTGKSCGKSSGSGTVSSKPSSSKPSSGSGSGSSSSSAPSTGTGTYADFQNQVVQLVNQERTSRGLKALSVDSALTNTATLKSQDMAKLGYFDHNSPTYGSPFDMMKQYGISYRTAGENIAMGQTSPQQVMTGWMNSEGHRANILNSSFTKIGVGIARNSNGTYYWTQQFIG